MMKSYCSILLSLQLLLPSCVDTTTTNINITYHETMINLGNNGSPQMIKWKLGNDNINQSLWNRDLSNKIYQHSFKDTSLTKIIEIPVEGPNSADFSDFFLGSDELILTGIRGIYKYDALGNQLSKILFHSIDTLGIAGKAINLRFENNYWSDPNNYDKRSDRVYLYYYDQAKSFNEQPLIASINVTSGIISFHKVPFPEEIESTVQTKRIPALRNFHYPSISVAGDKLVCSYGGFNEFFYVKTSDLYNIQNPTWHKVEIQSNFNHPKFNFISGPLKSIVQQNAYFGHIKWDPFRKLYYRISFLPTDPDEVNVKANPILLVMDSNFTKLAELKLKNDLRLTGWQVGKKGIYTLLPSDVENIVKFQIIEVNTG